ncbi:MAG: carbon-nitrogen hydrolase family protein [Thermoleophilaceae bacterium]
MRAAAIQLNSTDDRERNVARADRLVHAAAADGAELIVLPERFNLLGAAASYRQGAETLTGATITWAREIARELRVDLVAGSIVERREGHEKLSNTSVHIAPDGALAGVYRKIHMFDVSVAGRDYRESSVHERGEEVVLSDARGAGIGLTVCYDLRFPELFRILAIRGARVITLPSAFTKLTGAAHWDVLIRARAIENQVFVVAADQIGTHPPGDESFGGSQIVGPWGEVLARAPDEECFVTADLDLDHQDEVRSSLPSLANRVPSAYHWPDQGATATPSDRAPVAVAATGTTR